MSPTEECLLEDVSKYRYLTFGNVPVPGMDDLELYRQLLEAFDIMNLTKDEQVCEWNGRRELFSNI